MHVKDFIIRHRKLLGLTENDVTVMNALKQDAVKTLNRLGYTWKGE
jgi:hypothetical protein